MALERPSVQYGYVIAAKIITGHVRFTIRLYTHSS